MVSELPAEMQAAVYHRRHDLRIETRPVPEPGPEEVLLKISYCGVCGTDLHLVMDGWGRPGSINGHEFSGHIVAMGEQVAGWSLGEAVIGGPEPSCGHCDPCLAHRPMLCEQHSTPGVSDFQGAFAEYMRVPASQLLRLPEGLGLREAALAEPLAVALHGITRSGIEPGQRALITGVGPIGMLTLAALRARGIDDITVSEPSPTRRRLAGKLGASRTLEPEAIDVPPMPFTIPDDACQAAFECSGNPDALEAALTQLCKGGTLVIQGTGARRAKLDGHRILLNELVITGAYCYDEDGVADALALLASGQLQTDLLLHSEDMPLSEIYSGIERLAAGEIGGKLLIVPGLPGR
jgi:(R,R)-butanediol dehydrogenase/meso-butanediol dehydrogenase/diacetyl reductase